MTVDADKPGHFVSVTISAQNTFSASLHLGGETLAPFTAIVVAGTHVATPTLQFSEDDTNWSDFDINNFPALTNIGAERSGQVSGDFFIRIGCKTSEYTSGDIEMHIKRSF